MKKLLLMGLIGLSITAVSCDKHKEHYGTYTTTETRTYEGSMMAGDVDLSDQTYILNVEEKNNKEIILENVYEAGTRVNMEIEGSALTIRKQSLDGFLDIEGTGSISDNVIHLNYKVLTPDGNVVCVLHAAK